MPSEARRVVAVAAYADNRVIGHHGRIPWHSAEDFAHFKRETLGHTLVMGRLTFDSIGRPLPGRRTIVVTRSRDWTHEGVAVRHGEEVDLATVDACVLEPAASSGADLVQALAQASIPTVLVSIWPPSVELEDLEPVAYLLKPFALADLERALLDAVRRIRCEPA